MSEYKIEIFQRDTQGKLAQQQTFRPQSLQLLVTKQIMIVPHKGCPALPTTVQVILRLPLCTKVRDIEGMSHRVPSSIPCIPCYTGKGWTPGIEGQGMRLCGTSQWSYPITSHGIDLYCFYSARNVWDFLCINGYLLEMLDMWALHIFKQKTWTYMYILFTRCTIHNGIVATIYIHILTTLPASLSLELIDHRHAGWLAYIQCFSPKESLPLTWLNCSKNNALTGQFG